MSGEDNQKFSMEMISVGTEVHDDGRVEPIYTVQFTSHGQTFTYPWKHLKETVLHWAEIEKELGEARVDVEKFG